MGGKRSKQAGSSYEYRVRDWFNEREGWAAKRIALSGAVEEIGRHDVHAWKGDIYLTIEAKKRTKVKDEKRRDEIEIKSEWIDKIDFFKDEILVFATNRSPHYCMVPTKRFFQILNRSFDIIYNKTNSFKGDKQFKFKRGSVDDSPNKRFHLKWGSNEDTYTVLLLDEFITLRETANLDDKLSPEDKIKRLTSLDLAIEFEKLYLDELNYKQKRLLYMKMEELESGTAINPIFHAESQFYLDDAFILICPHCNEKVTKDHLQAPTE